MVIGAHLAQIFTDYALQVGNDLFEAGNDAERWRNQLLQILLVPAAFEDSAFIAFKVAKVGLLIVLPQTTASSRG